LSPASASSTLNFTDFRCGSLIYNSINGHLSFGAVFGRALDQARPGRTDMRAQFRLRELFTFDPTKPEEEEIF